MAKKSGIASLILAIIFGVIAIVTLPGLFSYFYRAGAGHAMRDIIESENLQWDSMSNAERVPYLARGKSEGLKCAFLMTLGEHVPLYLLAIITIGLITRSKSRRFRVFLRFAFFSVWVLGMLFLSLGIGYWGQATEFPESLSYVILIYLALLVFFGTILGIGKLIQRLVRKEVDQPTGVGNIQG